ncbi:MAG: MFS transporter [Bacillota bacterium]|jgi:MFS family permease|nr:MAG: MFS transporter [Bacillota bacterium]
MAAGGQDHVNFRTVLSRRDFFRVWLSQAVSYLGDRLTQVALTIYVLRLSEGSATAIGVFLLAQSVPVIVLGPFAGVLVDRWDKRRTMVACDVARAAIIACAPFLGDARLLYLIAFLMSAVSTVFTPALQASVPELLGRREEILVANSLLYSTKYFTDLLGFSLAGAVVMAAGLDAAFFIDSFTFMLSALFIIGVSKVLVAGTPKRITPAGVWEDLKAGIRYHGSNPVVLSLLVSFGLGVLAMGGLNTLLIVAVERLLGVGEYWWGFLLSVQAVFMFAATAATGRWGQKVPRPLLIVPGFLGIGLCAIALSVTRSLPLAFVVYAVLGVANALFLVPSVTWIQEVVPFELRGRVLGLRGMVLNLSAIISYAVAGPLGDILGVTPVMAGIGAFLCLAAVFSATLPGFRDSFARKPPADLPV